MFKNPFTPTFGGKPDFFFGRRGILDDFDKAMENRGSADRVLFVTGSRGCGKTALLEQFSQRAAAQGRRTIDVNSENALGSLMRHLVRHQSVTKEIAPEVKVTVFGTGGKLGGVSSSKTTRYEKEDLEIVFCEACGAAEKGMFVSIDEVQKISLDDLSAICGAFQMASRKGYDVMLAIAGLPYAYDRIIQHEGCTYMRRSVHIRLGVFDRKEAAEAFLEAFGSIRGLSVEDEALSCLVQASYGHPYFIQLAGYALVDYVNGRNVGSEYAITKADVEAILPEVIQSYEVRSLAPIVDALPPSARAYLEAMARCIGEDHVARTKDIAREMAKSPAQVSQTRQKLVSEGIAVAVERGGLMFNIPYLRAYVSKRPETGGEADLAREWMF